MSQHCSHCGAGVADGARFCAACGRPLTPACPDCGEEVPEGARFCPSCGTALEAEAAGGPTEARKVVSVLFADLAGFTAHTEQSDPEDVRARLTAYHSRVREDVERFGGRIEKLMGDGVFAVFGMPTAHEDDPERAVRAGLRVQESIDELNAEGMDLSVRIAVTTGEAVVQLGESDREGIVGDVVNTASRLEGLAPPGGVLTDQRTYLAARRAVAFEPMDPVMVKGKAEPVTIWSAVSVISRFGVAVEEDDVTPFLGRDRELSVLVDHFDRVAEQQSAHLVTIIGEPGVGKSRLLREFFHHVDDRPEVVFWRQGRCLPYGEGVTFWAIGEVVKAHADILDGESPAVAGSKLRAAIASLVDNPQDASWMERMLAPLIGIEVHSAAGEQAEFFAAGRRFFEAMAAQSPLVLVIEDLHWADEGLIDFLDQITDWSVASPILLICTARPELFTDHPAWGSGKRNAASVSLDPLPNDVTAQLIAGLMPRHLTTAETQQTLLERCGGNPLYAIEFARLAAEGGAVDLMPANLEALVTARLDLLDTAERSFLQAAAVVGKVFWSGAVGFMLAEDPGRVSTLLRSLIARELIRPSRRSSMQGQDEFAFLHVLVRDVAYGQIPRADRARLHDAAASWLEAASAERSGDVAELLLHHYGEAIANGRLTAKERPEIFAKAYRFAMAAAQRTKTLDLAKAITYLERAEAVASGPLQEGLALIERSRLELGGGRDNFDETAIAAVELLEPLDEPLAMAQALQMVSRNEWLRGNSDAADDAASRSVAMVDGLPLDAEVGKIMAGYAGHLMLRGREDEARDWGERALALGREVGDAELVAKALSNLGVVHLRPGDLSGFDMLRQALGICLDRGDTDRAVVAYNNLVTTLQYVEGPAEAIELIDKAIALAEQRGYEGNAAWSRMTKLEHLMLAGSLDELDDLSKQVLGWDEEIGGSQVGFNATAFRASINYWRGNLAAAERDVDAMFANPNRTDDPQVIGPSLGIAAAVYERVRRIGEVRALAEQVLQVTDEVRHWRAVFIPLFADALVAADSLDLLRTLVDGAWSLGDLTRARIDGARARLAEAEGDLDEAIRLLRHSIDVVDRYGMRLDSGELRVRLARVLAAAGDEKAAPPLLDEARDIATQIGAGLILSDIAELEGRATEAGSA